MVVLDSWVLVVVQVREAVLDLLAQLVPEAVMVCLDLLALLDP